MESQPMVLIALMAGVVILALATWLLTTSYRRRRSAALREHFGPEYDRAIEQYGDQARAERELAARRRRMQKLHIRLLSPQESERFGASWSEVQKQFVDDPSGAVAQADDLVKQVMNTRGYPTENFEQCVADLSVEHSNVVHHYRAARKIVRANSDSQAQTEDLRQALVLYRALFTELLQTYEPHPFLSEAQKAQV